MESRLRSALWNTGARSITALRLGVSFARRRGQHTGRVGRRGCRVGTTVAAPIVISSYVGPSCARVVIVFMIPNILSRRAVVFNFAA